MERCAYVGVYRIENSESGALSKRRLAFIVF